MIELDRALYRLLNSIPGLWEPLEHLVRILTGDYLIPLASTLALASQWVRGRDRRERERCQHGVLVGLAAVGLVNLAVELIANAVGRARPYVGQQGVQVLFYLPTDPSFPSNPVAVAAVIAEAGRRIDPNLGRWLWRATAVLGVSRVMAGVHYPSDVVVGALLGAAVVWAAAWLLARLEVVPRGVIRLARALGLA